MIHAILHSKPEASLVAIFRLMCAASVRPAIFELPWFDPSVDRVAYEVVLPHGRADIVVFHMDGSATVIEAKDGGKGATAVAQGIGQVSLYAAQLMLKGRVSKVRKALMWTSAGLEVDAMVEASCELAGVIAIPFASLEKNRSALIDI